MNLRLSDVISLVSFGLFLFLIGGLSDNRNSVMDPAWLIAIGLSIATTSIILKLIFGKTFVQQNTEWFYSRNTTKCCFLFSFIFFVLSVNYISVNGTVLSDITRMVFAAISLALLFMGINTCNSKEHEWIMPQNKGAWWKYFAHIPLVRLVVLSPPNMDTYDF